MATSPDDEISFDMQRISDVNDSAHNDELQHSHVSEQLSINDPQPGCDLSRKSGPHVQFRLDRESTPSRDDARNTSYDDARRSRYRSSDDDSSRLFDQNCGDSVWRSRSSAPSNLNIKPDTFDGSHAFENYLSHFEDCAELCMWDARTKVLMLASCLRDTARVFYMSLLERERRDYRVLTERLASRFGDFGKNQQLWLNQFDSRKRQRNESISSLAYDLRRLAHNAYVDLDNNAQEHLALNQLYKLISIDMKCRCIDQNCTTIAEAVSVIERYESIMGTPHMNVRSCKDDSVETKLKQMQNRISNLESRNIQQATPRCYGCNSPDHFWKFCPQNMNTRRYNQHVRPVPGRPRPRFRQESNFSAATASYAYDNDRSSRASTPHSQRYTYDRPQNVRPQHTYNDQPQSIDRSRTHTTDMQLKYNEPHSYTNDRTYTNDRAQTSVPSVQEN